MTLAWPSADTLNAGLRHVYTATATCVATLLFVGVLTQGDATTITAAVHKIGDGVSSIVAGITMLVPIASGIYAMLSATLKARLTAVAKDPEVKSIVVATPAVANAVPSAKVTSTP